MPPIFDINNCGGYSPNYFDPAIPGYSSTYNDYMNVNQPLASYQGADNSGYEVNGQYENLPTDLLSNPNSGKDNTLDWNPINLAKLYPKLYLSPLETYSHTPFKNSRIPLQKDTEKLSADKMEDFINSDSFPVQDYIGSSRTAPVPHVNNDVWKSLFKLMTGAKQNESDASYVYSDPQKINLNHKKLMTNTMDINWPDDQTTKFDIRGLNSQQNISMTNISSINGETERLPLPEKLVKKKSAQMKALQNLSKLKAMIHMAKEDRRAVQHKREEARRQFLSEVAEELQLMSSAKLAEIEASKSYGALSAAERALADKDRDIHMLLEKEDTLYEDLTDAEASLAKADMNFIPKIKSEDELRQFASFLNFGF